MKTLALGKGKMHNIVIFKGKFLVPLNDTVIIRQYETGWGGEGKGVGGKKNFFKTDFASFPLTHDLTSESPLIPTDSGSLLN